MRFPYQEYEISPSPIDGSVRLYRPEIPMHLIGEIDELFVFGLLDTGADGVVIGREIARQLGVLLDETIRWKLHGFGAHSIEAVLGHLDIEIMDGNASLAWKMPVAVVAFDNEQEEIVLLGQTGVLQYFDIRFLGSDCSVELVPNATFPQPK